MPKRLKDLCNFSFCFFLVQCGKTIGTVGVPGDTYEWVPCAYQEVFFTGGTANVACRGVRGG